MLEIFMSLGIIISLFYYEITEISPGGLISPIYIALFIDQPKRIIGTIIIAIIICYILKFLGKYILIYGKRRFALAIILGIFFKMGLGGDVLSSYVAIGSVVPGLIAFECDKQGVFSTISGLCIVTLILKVLLITMEGKYFLW